MEKEKKEKSIKLTNKELEILKSIKEEKAKLQELFQNSIDKESIVLSLIQDKNKLKDNIIVEKIVGDKLIYNER